MSITGYRSIRVGNTHQITVASDLIGKIYYHWYRDGQYLIRTVASTYSMYLPPNAQARILVIDTNDPDFDPLANNPDKHPGHRSIHWIRSLATDVDHYRIEQNKDGAGWTGIATSKHNKNQWVYIWVSGILDDLSDYQWRIIPVDRYGNDGTALTYQSETIVRFPDAPNFRVTYDDVSDTITFIEV